MAPIRCISFAMIPAAVLLHNINYAVKTWHIINRKAVERQWHRSQGPLQRDCLFLMVAGYPAQQAAMEEQGQLFCLLPDQIWKKTSETVR